ncbi:MAG TPA: Zn-dependent alcohol dehydrogenase [Streptosporangiaceae bacterium]|nr:Zn-dependent alcohol dehydrogenase [Streptosporangiaceae bacterium]
MRAAVLHEIEDAKIEVRDDVAVVGPRAGEVLIKVRAAGVCHSDLSVRNGGLPQPMPVILGHEAAGEILAVGEAVTGLAPGDHVIASWQPPCGTCAVCLHGQPHLCFTHAINAFITPRFVVGGTPAFGMMGCGAFAEQMVVPQQGAVKIADDVPFDLAALVGCSVMTGVGAVINTAKVRPGSTVVVIGCGGVGISVIQGARASGASTIVAVDTNAAKQETARQFGATHGVHPDGLAELLGPLTLGEGFDYAFEAVGSSQTTKMAWGATRRGGHTVIVGAGGVDEDVELSLFELLHDGKTLTGSLYGEANIRTDFHRLLSLWRAGRLDLEGMITHRIGLDDINEALTALGRGEVIRQVIIHD